VLLHFQINYLGLSKQGNYCKMQRIFKNNEFEGCFTFFAVNFLGLEIDSSFEQYNFFVTVSENNWRRRRDRLADYQ